VGLNFIKSNLTTLNFNFLFIFYHSFLSNIRHISYLRIFAAVQAPSDFGFVEQPFDASMKQNRSF
jgi:hypothetical protein